MFTITLANVRGLENDNIHSRIEKENRIMAWFTHETLPPPSFMVPSAHSDRLNLFIWNSFPETESTEPSESESDYSILLYITYSGKSRS